MDAQTSLENLHNRIDLVAIPFSERGSRMLLFRQGDKLFLRLAERWVKWETEVGPYRQRPPIIEHLSILNADGHSVSFEVESYPHVVTLHSAVGDFHWAFYNTETLITALPAGRYSLSFEVRADTGQADARGGTFRGKRNASFTTNATIFRNQITMLESGRWFVHLEIEAAPGDALLLNVTPRFGFERSIPDPARIIEDSKWRWVAWFEAAPPVLDVYRRQYDYAWWVMRNGLLSTRFYLSRETMTPSKIHYVGIWHWDQFFHALAYRHVDTRLAEDQLRILIDHQRADGMLPDAIHDEGTIMHLSRPVDADVTKPPLMSWTALKLYEKSHHLDFLKEIYEPLTRWHEWWLRDNRDETSGLCVYRHPFSSGLDDSPLWDQGMPVVAPDLNAYLLVQQQSLATIADLVGKPDDAAHYRSEATFWAEHMTEALWDEKKGWFNALYNGKPIQVLTPFHLLPLWTGAFSPDIHKQLLTHLNDPTTFAGKWPIPTVAYNDPTFDPMQMWRGPVWTNINYLFIEGLRRVGEAEAARNLRLKTLDLTMQHHDIYEYYNPLTGERPAKAAPLFGWTSAVFIDLAIEETQYVTENGTHGSAP